MSDGDLNTQVLREIRDELRGTNARLDQTNERLTSFEHTVGESLTAVGARLTAVEHTVADFAAQQLLAIRYMKSTFRRHDDAIEDLDERVSSLETDPDPKRSGS